MTVSMIGALFNTAVIVAIIIDPLKILRKGPWITIFNLAIADIIACISNFCLWGRGFFHQDYDSVYMHTSYFGWGFGVSASFLFLTFLSVRIFVITRFPLKSRFIITNVKTALVSIVIWLISFVLGLSQIAYLGYTDLHTILKIYTAHIGVLELAVLILLILNLQVAIHFLRRRHRSESYSSQNIKEKHFAKIVLLLTLILFLTAFPYFVLKQMEYFTRMGYFGEGETARWFAHVCYIYLPITMLNFSANPILYSLRLPEYKETLSSVFRKSAYDVTDPRSKLDAPNTETNAISLGSLASSPTAEWNNHGEGGGLKQGRGELALSAYIVFRSDSDLSVLQWTLSKADTLGTKFIVHLRQVSAIERAEKFDTQMSKSR